MRDGRRVLREQLIPSSLRPCPTPTRARANQRAVRCAGRRQRNATAHRCAARVRVRAVGLERRAVHASTGERTFALLLDATVAAAATAVAAASDAVAAAIARAVCSRRMGAALANQRGSERAPLRVVCVACVGAQRQRLALPTLRRRSAKQPAQQLVHLLLREAVILARRRRARRIAARPPLALLCERARARARARLLLNPVRCTAFHGLRARLRAGHGPRLRRARPRHDVAAHPPASIAAAAAPRRARRR